MALSIPPVIDKVLWKSRIFRRIHSLLFHYFEKFMQRSDITKRSQFSCSLAFISNTKIYSHHLYEEHRHLFPFFFQLFPGHKHRRTAPLTSSIRRIIYRCSFLWQRHFKLLSSPYGSTFCPFFISLLSITSPFGAALASPSFHHPPFSSCHTFTLTPHHLPLPLYH